MFTRTVVAVLIAISALVFPFGEGWEGASAEPRGERGRSRGRGRERGHYRHHEPENPLGSIIGGIFGGWLAEKMRDDEPEAPFRDEEIEGDDALHNKTR